jgi:phosphate starvation-inducible PhoH-like protein
MSRVKHTGDFESLEVTDGKVKIHQRDTIKPRENFYIEELPWTEKQKRFIEISLNKSTRLMLCKGPAGSSKTLIAVYAALNLLNDSKVSDVIYMRSAVESSDSRLGFLPGDADEKLHYYNLPFMDKLDELLNEDTVKKLQRDQRVSIHPVNFARGMSWNGKAILLDEAQNSSFREIVTVLTRIGRYSRAFIMADPMQTDLKNGNRGGFEKIFSAFDNEESRDMGIHTFEFDETDIVRSAITRFIVQKINTIENH